jgi:tetratricopeptide (TPR) repeat protein
MTRLLILGMLLLAAPVLSAAAMPQDGVVQEIALGDAAYAKFDNSTALQHFLKALQEDPKSYQALWKGARAYADVGKTFEKSDKNKAKALYLRGDSLAREAVKLYPDSADAHFALALCVGRVALFEGGKTKIRLSKEVKQEADRTIALNPNHDSAYHILGRWHYNISTLSWVLKAFAKMIYGGVPPGASLERGAEMFAKAVEINGNKPVHRLEYARTLIELGRHAEARDQFQTCVSLPQAQWDDPMTQEEAAKLLKEIGDKRDKT